MNKLSGLVILGFIFWITSRGELGKYIKFATVVNWDVSLLGIGTILGSMLGRGAMPGGTLPTDNGGMPSGITLNPGESGGAAAMEGLETGAENAIKLLPDLGGL